MHLKLLAENENIKGAVQQKLTWVKNGING
jgi:hypothetical protein